MKTLTSLNFLGRLGSVILFALTLAKSEPTLIAQTPEWIWHDNQGRNPQPNETRFFRKTFQVGFKPVKATLTATGDDQIAVYLNGWKVAQGTNWMSPITLDVTTSMLQGQNVLAVQGRNGPTSPAAILVKLEVRSPNNFGLFVITDKSWQTSDKISKGWNGPEADPADWNKPVSFGKVGVAPWGHVMTANLATPAESLTLLPGFKAELLKSATREEGSWICMTMDSQGRFIISPEKYAAPMWRITLDSDHQVAKTDPIPAPVRGAMGLLYAHDSLYVNGHGPQGPGLYRLIDQNGNDQFDPDEVRLLKHFEGDNEHGYHAIVLGPDKMIYILNGNHTKVPQSLSPNSPYQNYAEDLLLPRMWDPNGHARNIFSPGGYIVRTDPEGKTWELMCGGFRNAYDLDFNTDGEMFTFDADMEWDVGCPWYRPNRINHCVSGGEYGWRSGSGKWPTFYPDSLPSNLDMGLSSPTGVKFGTRSHFPPKYRQAFYVCDWAYGKIFAVHLRPDGSSYAGTFETFLAGRPLSVVDLEFGPDGAMYFINGGWRTQSGLYRVSYHRPFVAQSTPTQGESTRAREAARQRAIRRRLESFHGKKDPQALEFAWPYLDSPDRWLRFAARIAIESQDVSLWQQRALAETRTTASINALLALARKGDDTLQEDLLTSLKRLTEKKLTSEQSLEALRVLQLALIRFDQEDPNTFKTVAKTLLPFFPAQDEEVSRELCRLLVYLQSPEIIDQALDLMTGAKTQETQMQVAFFLGQLKSGWNMKQRLRYFSWLQTVQHNYSGGNSFEKYLDQIRNESIKGLRETERKELASVLVPTAKDTTAATAPPRPFVKEWTMEELIPTLGQAGHGRSFKNAQAAFAAAQCAQCHRLGKEGRAIGPDLTGVAGRFNRPNLLEHIMLPSKIISDRYQTISIILKDDEEVTGTILEETDEKVVMINPSTQQLHEILKKEIQSRQISTLSAMPEGLVNVLTQEEILDLLAYLESDGHKEATCFQPAYHVK